MRWWILAVALSGCTTSPPDSADGPCNGDSSYCDVPYNEVAQICTHNAMSNVADGFSLPTPNQTPGLTRQLQDGVRCLMLDTYWFEDEAQLCHGMCGPWGQRPLHDGLVEIRKWLADNPREILAFVLEAYIYEDETRQALDDAGLLPYLYSHGGIGTPWPTNGEMIDSDQRLVVFTDDADANGNWHLDWRTHGWETPFNDDTFTCDNGRGDPLAAEHQIFILNHYTLCESGGCPENGEINNAYDFLLERALECSVSDPAMNPAGQLPTFINLDHYDVPTAGSDPSLQDAFEVIRELNGGFRGADD